jgi:catechol 2,3-dioxygenase-like lactoylglutathione lyase family enzyme
MESIQMPNLGSAETCGSGYAVLNRWTYRTEEEDVLSDTDAIATCAVKDIEIARKFYEGTLGLAPLPSQESDVLAYRSGKTSILVYQSQFAGSNKATAVTWAVRDLEGVVKALKAKGVRFEHYDLPGIARKGDIHGSGKTKAAWFKDPDGNILAVVSA